MRLPPHTFRVTTAGRIACSARQLVASIVGSNKKDQMAGNSRVKCAAKRCTSGTRLAALGAFRPFSQVFDLTSGPIVQGWVA